MADGSVKIEVGLDVGKAEKKLANLKDKISKAEDQLNKTSGQRDAISEQLDNAAKKAETARQKIAELNEELNKGSDPMAKPQDTKEIQAMIQKRNQLVEELRKIDTTATRALQEDINRAKGEQAGYQSHLEKIEDRAARLGISPDKYAKEVDKIKSTKLQPLEERIAQLSSQLDIMRQASGEAALSSQIRDLDRRIGLERQKAAEATGAPSAEEAQKINAQIVEQQKLIKDAEKEAEKLKTEFEKVDEKVKDGEKDLEEMKSQAGQMVDAIEKARPGEALARGLEQARKSMWKFLKYALGIRSVFFLWKRLRAYISDAIALYAEYDKETKYNLALMQATKKAVQGTFGSSFVQIYTALLPVIQKITNWMLEAANAAARFIAILSGKGSYKRAVVDAEEVAKSLEDSADAADETADGVDDTAESVKQLQRTLAPIDELNIIGNGDDGGLGAGKEKTEKEKAEKVAKTAIDGIKYVEESLETLNDSFLDKFALNFKDVLFNWDDLNPEQIAKKIIAGLGTLLGAALGIALGLGPGGVLMMTLAGLIMGLVIDTLIFDNDGKLSEHEIVSMIIIALGALVGGIIGIMAGGGFKGALIGIWIGAGIGLLIQQLLVKKGVDLSFNSLMKALIPILNAIVGGIAGFLFTANPVGAAVGAVIGATLGAGLTMLIQKFTMNASEKGKVTAQRIAKILTVLVGAYIGFSVGGPVGAIVGLVAASIVVAITSIILDKKNKGEDYKNSEFGREVAALKEDIQKGLETNADIKVHIDSITGEIDESTIADLAVAQNLIDSIFTLDAKSNKTTEEAALLQQQIETLNGLGLEGIQLSFDETTGHVNGTRQEIQGLLDDLMQQYKLEAMKEAYIESFKAQFEATEDVKHATDDAKAASEKYNTAVENLTTAQNDYNQALSDYTQYRDEIMSAGSGGAVSQEAEDAANRLAEAGKALDLAKQGVKDTKEAAEEAKTYLETSLETADLATEKVEAIEKALTDLATATPEKGKEAAEGFGEGMSKHSQKSVDAAKDMAQGALDEITDVLDAHSPSKETEKRGEWAVEGFENGVRNKTPDAVNAVKDMMDQIFREFDTSIEKIKRLMNFSWSLPRPRIPQIGWNIKTVSYGRGQSVSIPQFFVNWYAKGGVFDFPSLIGVGESGKEAVVPLEKNTEWMSTVADGLMDRLKQANFANQLADAFMRTPMPAMAGGGIVPPGAIQGGGGFSTSGIEDAIERGVYNAMVAMGNNRRSGGFEIKINGREFMRAVYDDFKAVENEHGISMIET